MGSEINGDVRGRRQQTIAANGIDGLKGLQKKEKMVMNRRFEYD